MNTTVVNGGENDSLSQVLWTDLQFYPLITFMYGCVVMSLLGNVAVMVALWSKNVESLSGKFVKVITILDIGLTLAFFVPICVTMTTDHKEWILGRSGCLLQGILENSLLIGHSIFMFYLTLEKFYMFKRKEEMKWMTEHFDKVVALTILCAILACTFPLLGDDTCYLFLQAFQRCVLTGQKFGGFLRFLFYITPNAIVLLLWTIMAKGAVCRANRISDAGDVAQDNYTRGSNFRGSIFTTSDNPNANALASFAESRRTTKLSMVQIPLSLLHLTSGILFFLYFVLGDHMNLMSAGSLLTFAAAMVAQPLLLFAVNSPLRTALKRVLTKKRRPSALPTTFKPNEQPIVPREDPAEEMPEFLRQNASGMLIKVRVLSTPDTAGQGQDKHDFEVALPIKTSDKGYSSMPTTPISRSLKLETASRRKSTSESSGDSLNANAETRSSVSSFSEVVLNVSDLCTRPLARIRINSEFVYDPPSPTSSTASEPITDPRRLSLPCRSRHNSFSSPKLWVGKSFKTVLPDKSKLTLQPVEDMSSPDTTPRASSNTNPHLTQDSNTC